MSLLFWYLVGLACELASLAVLGAAVAGIGLLVRRGFGLTSIDVEDCFTAFWVGFCAIILALLLWHFVLPVNVAILALVLAVGALGLIISRHNLKLVWSDDSWRPHGAWSLAYAAAALYVANQGLGGLTYSDSALYHLQAVAWNKSYALVPGLANLYGPLGFNNASLLYGAMLDVGPWHGLGHRLANGLLLLALLLRIVVAITRFTRNTARSQARELFVITLIPGVLCLSLLGRLSSYATATSTALIVLAVAEQLYGLLVGAARSDLDAAYTIFCITTFSAVAVTLKVSAVVFAAPATLLALAVWWRKRPRADGLLARTLAFTLGAAVLIGGAWMARGVMLSGYPLFPSKLAAFPVDWRAPVEHADAEYALAAHSSMASTTLTEVIAGRDRWGWIPHWFTISLRDPFDYAVPTTIALLAGLFALVRRRRSGSGLGKGGGNGHETVGQPAPVLAPPLLMLIPTIIAIVAWFLLAPEGRYAIGFFWALAGVSVAELWRTRGARSVALRGVVLGTVATALVTLLVVPLLHVRIEASDETAKALIKSAFKLWDSRGWYRQIELPKLERYTTASGLVLNVPTDRCWAAPPDPIPCTPNPSRTLELRHPPDIKSGFRVRGEWAMEYWPFRSRPDFLRAWRESRAR